MMENRQRAGSVGGQVNAAGSRTQEGRSRRAETEQRGRRDGDIGVKLILT